MPSTTQTTASTSITLQASGSTSSTSASKTQQAEDLDIYDEIEIEDMTFDATLQIYHYPCPCGDRFEIGLDALRSGETSIAVCPSCSLMVRIIYEVEDLPAEADRKSG